MEVGKNLRCVAYNVAKELEVEHIPDFINGAEWFRAVVEKELGDYLNTKQGKALKEKLFI
jgi:hypothetical protein